MENEIKHIGLQIREKDLEEFYVNVLEFKLLRTFTLSAEEADEIFGINQAVKILFGGSKDIELELFINESPRTPTFSHVCFHTVHASEIADKASLKGYRTFIRGKDGKETFFISDSNHNLFEIKNKLKN